MNMMIFAGIVTSFLFGISILNFISGHFTILEKVGLSFLLGIASQTLLMLFLDSINIELSIVNVLAVSYLFILLLNIKVVIDRRNALRKLNEICFKIPSGVNFVWLLFIILIVCFEYMNWRKCMFYPTFDRDSLTAFDTIGWIISQEKTLKGLSIFQGDYMSGVNAPGSFITYMPMIQLSYAYVYSLGMETSKIIPALIYLSFLISFYAVAKSFCGRTGAAIGTFFVLITPEMLAFSSLSGTNVIHAGYASLGIIYTVLWLRSNDKKYFVLSVLLMTFSLWIRNEGIAFVGAAILIVFLYKLKGRNFKYVFIYAFCSLLPLVLWSVFMKINGIYAENIIILKPFVDTDKMQTIWMHLTFLLTETSYYGISFWVFAIAILFNIKRIIRRGDLLSLLGIIFISLFFYVIILYQIDYKWDRIENVLQYSAKRFLFCFIPLVWLYTVANNKVATLLGKLEKALSF